MPFEAESPAIDEVRRSYLHALPDPVLVADAESRYLYANDAALNLLGYTLAELRAMTVKDIVAHAPEWTAEEYQRFLKDGFWEGRVVVRNRSQALVVVESRATVVRLPDRTEYISVLRESRTPPAPSPSKARARILVVDDDPANRRLLADLVVHEGYEAVTATGGADALAILANVPVNLVLLDLMMPQVDGMAVLAELQKQQRLPALPVVVVTAHDERKVRIDALTAGAIDFIAKPIDRLEVVCRLRTLVELSQLRERAVATVEDKLRESDHLLRLRFDQSPVATIAWDTSFRVIAWNPAAEKLFGYTEAEALGLHAAFIVPEDQRAHVDARWRELPGGRANESTNENVTRDGRTIQCEWHNAPLTSADGTLLGGSSVILDVTERLRLKATLAQSQKMEAMGQLAGGVAHDFNNILSVILSYGSFIRDTLPEDDERRDDIIEVLKAGDRAVALTRQLLTFTRQQPTEKRLVDLNQSLSELHKLLLRTLGADVELHAVPSARPAVVRIDPVQFDQIVLNLAVNARDAMP
ncbi:MAG: PAS domain S-box protein, partial [Spirochaetaceae bacterium]|nr:PAS domain S-box protein [Spirochaetaceae bacterium]